MLARDGLKISTEAGLTLQQLRSRIHGWSVDLTLGTTFHRIPKRRFRRFFARDFLDLALTTKGGVAGRFSEVVCGNPLKGLKLNAGEVVLASTSESLELPSNLVAIFSGRSSYASLGLSIELSQIILQPGHAGVIRLQLKNNLPYPIRLYPGSAIVQVVFFRTGSRVSEDYSEQESAKYRDGDQRSKFYADPFYTEVRIRLNEHRPRDWAEPWEKVVGAAVALLTVVLAVLPEGRIQRYGFRSFLGLSVLLSFFLIVRWLYREK